MASFGLFVLLLCGLQLGLAAELNAQNSKKNKQNTQSKVKTKESSTTLREGAQGSGADITSANGTSVAKTPFMIGQLVCGRAINFKESKLEAGLALALDLTSRYSLINARVVDSVAKLQHLRTGDSIHTTTALKLAPLVGAKGSVFLRVDRLENILRAEVQIAQGDSFKTIARGQGYALIRFRTEKKNRLVSDPAVLTAIQRALCVALGDTTLYEKAPAAFKVKPAETVVPGGLVFSDDASLDAWDMFKNHTVNAYDAVVNIFDALKDSPNYVCYDVDTRDSIYALYKMYVIENDNEPSRQELDALYRLEVKYYITGTLRRVEAGAELKLYFCEITNNASYRILRTAQELIKEDKMEEFREKLQASVMSLCQE